MQNDQAKRVFIIALTAFIGLLIIAAAIYLYVTSKNQYGDAIKIQNLGSYTAGKPVNKERVDFVQHDLFNTVNKNLDKPVKGSSVKDALVRDGTFSQTYNDKVDVYTVKFIVDIASLKQSYDVSYQWVESGDSYQKLDEYGTGVRCLPKDKLKFGDFNCKDMFTQLQPTEPLLQHLPYTTPNIDVVLDPRAEKTLSVTIQTSAADERTDPDAAIALYKSQVNSWLRSVGGVDPSDYTIRYDIVHASLY